MLTWTAILLRTSSSVLVWWKHNQLEQTRERASGSFHVSPHDLFCGKKKKKRRQEPEKAAYWNLICSNSPCSPRGDAYSLDEGEDTLQEEDEEEGHEVERAISPVEKNKELLRLVNKLCLFCVRKPWGKNSKAKATWKYFKHIFFNIIHYRSKGFFIDGESELKFTQFNVSLYSDIKA